MEKYEKGNGNRRLSNQQNGIPPGWEELPNGEIEKGIPQHILKQVTSHGLSKESKLKRGKE